MVTISDSQRTVLETVRGEISSRREGRRGPGRLPDQLRRDVLALIDAGLDPASVAAETGLSLAALERWQRDSAAPALATDAPSPPPRVFAVEPPPAPLPALAQRTSSCPATTGAMRVQFGAFIVTIELAESA